MRGQRGFTYLMLLWWVAISGVMLMALSHSWTMERRREREAELVFRGDQIKRAIEAYAKVPVSDKEVRLPKSLEDLLTDRRSGSLVRHLRRQWSDPVTGGQWGLIKQGDYILGVYSTSPLAPISAPDGTVTYAEWRFEAPPDVALQAP